MIFASGVGRTPGPLRTSRRSLRLAATGSWAMRAKSTEVRNRRSLIRVFGMPLRRFFTISRITWLPIQVGPNNTLSNPGNAPMVSITVCAPGTTNCQTAERTFKLKPGCARHGAPLRPSIEGSQGPQSQE